jgi:purine-binding chemotaxis protein CheW
MPELAAAPEESAERRFLAFRIGDRLYALPAEDVAEIVRVPSLARVPQAPPGLLGLANLRGRVTPVASLRALVAGESQIDATGGLALLLAGAAPVAIAVEGAPMLVSVDEVQTDDAAIVARPSERVVGVFSVGDEVARVLDVQALLARSFTPRAASAAAARAGPASLRSVERRNDEADEEKFISFIVAGQEFALELDAVREVIAAPTTIAAVPHSEELVIGVTAHRESLLPLLSLRGLLGMGATKGDAGSKVLVSRIGGTLVGLVADQARAIVSVAEGESDPPPAVLTARTGAESQIKAVYRGEQGRRLISILSPDQLFRDEVMQRLAKSHPGREAAMASEDESEAAADRFLVFRLGEDEFALPIEAVIEVARVPEQITRVPKTPAFLEGVMSFRGEVLPVVDQRRRSDMAVREGDMTRRLIVVRSERHRAAVIVDAVSEVLSHPRDAMDPAPDLTGDQTRLVLGVINLDEAGRMVMVLDPTELLSRAERGLLDAFSPELPEPR